MTEEFAFNARQFFDFSQNHEDMDGDSFFEKNQEDDLLQMNGIKKDNSINGEVIELEFSDTESDSLFLSPMEGLENGGVSGSTIYLKSKMRRSLSMNNLPSDKPEHLQQAMEDLHLEDERPSSSCSHGSRRAASKEHINRLAQPKRFNSAENMNKMTLAEAVNKFQAGTPKRFRSKASPKINKYAPVGWGGTKAHSPKLLTTQRARPTHIMSQEERENLEVEEAKKFKIRAHPVSKKVLRGPMKCQVEKKPLTAIEPFKLTQIRKKDQVEIPKIPPFKAQPLPKSLHNPFKIQETTQPTTKPHTPNVVKRLNRSLPKLNSHDKVDAESKPFKPSKTEPIPFSFEERDKAMLKKKEEMINKVLEKEKKAREFHARPPPKAILRSRNGSLDQISDAGSTKSNKKSNEEMELAPIFKARPASVLHMKPFEPKKNEYHDLKIIPFQFSTDERAEAWKNLENQLKEREKMKEAYRREMEEQAKMKEEEEIARLRKLAEHKAQPIKKYKEIKIEKSNKVTLPISPVFHTDRLRNKENIEH